MSITASTDSKRRGFSPSYPHSPMITININPDNGEVSISDRSAETTNIISRQDMKYLIQTLHDLTYNKKADIYNLPTDVINLGTTLGIH